MTKGIQVFWSEGRQVDEIEHFNGIDVDDLSRMPGFTSFPADWPLEEDGSAIECRVRATRKPGAAGAVNLVVEYRPEHNADLISRYGYDRLWGTNRIVLMAGCRKGVCHWCRADGTQLGDIPWEAFEQHCLRF